MKVQETGFRSIEQMSDRYLTNADKAKVLTSSNQELSFRDILAQKTGTDLKFSKHAAVRLSDRNIELSPSQMERLTDGTIQAGAKGIKDSLVLMDRMAFIVNVPNRTVVTAMTMNEGGSDSGTDTNIFTNIDGAVIV
jgi:flagellar operon protein